MSDNESNTNNTRNIKNKIITSHICTVCQRPYNYYVGSGGTKKYCPMCYKTRHKYYKYVEKLKQYITEPKCEHCGYNKYMRALSVCKKLDGNSIVLCASCKMLLRDKREIQW